MYMCAIFAKLAEEVDSLTVEDINAKKGDKHKQAVAVSVIML